MRVLRFAFLPMPTEHSPAGRLRRPSVTYRLAEPLRAASVLFELVLRKRSYRVWRLPWRVSRISSQKSGPKS